MSDEPLTPLEEAIAQEEEEPYIPGEDVPEYPHDDPEGDRTEYLDHPKWQDLEEMPEVEEEEEEVEE